MVTKIDGDITNALTMRASGGSEKQPTPEGRKSDKPSLNVANVVQVPNYGLELRVDENTQEVTMMILDPESRAVIREIPAHEMKTAAQVIRALIGHLVDKRV